MTRIIPPPLQRLLVFARLPERGVVKTRLAREIGDDRTLAVYEAMLHDVLGGIGSSSGEIEIEVMWAPTAAADSAALRSAFGHHAVAMQTGETLGDRMAMAFSERFFFHATEKIVAIGVDEPTITRELLDHAFALLDSCEWVLGPAQDGGYYLIGSRGPTFDADVFRGIEWGTATVLEATLGHIRRFGNTVALLPERFDIDVAADLERFAALGHDGELARLIRTW